MFAKQDFQQGYFSLGAYCLDDQITALAAYFSGGVILKMETNWTTIAASVTAVLALIASIFSAVGAAKSADVAVSAEKRISAGERKAAKRELFRSAAKVEIEARMTLEVFARAMRTAKANATHYAGDRAIKHARQNAELQQRSDQVKERFNLPVCSDVVCNATDDEITKIQLDFDRTLIELVAEKEWAVVRAAELSKTNDHLGDDLLAEERSKGVFQRRNPDGRLI